MLITDLICYLSRKSYSLQIQNANIILHVVFGQLKVTSTPVFQATAKQHSKHNTSRFGLCSEGCSHVIILYSNMNKQTCSCYFSSAGLNIKTDLDGLKQCKNYWTLLLSGSPISFSCGMLLLLAILSAYLAKAAERADLTFNLGSFLCWLPSSSILFPSTSCSSLIERGLVLFWVGVSGTAGWVETMRLNGSWKVSYSRLTWWAIGIE